MLTLEERLKLFLEQVRKERWKTLDLSSVTREMRDCGVIQLDDGRTISIASDVLTTLPPEIGMLKDLEILYLSENKIQSLPPEIGLLTNLKILYLSSNELTNLPTELGKLKKLKELYISKNLLRTLPAEIGNLASLEKLYLDNNQLANLPSEIGNLKNLRALILGSSQSFPRNQISQLPDSLFSLINLEELSLQHCWFNNDVPKGISKLQNLRILDLSENRLTRLSEEVFDLVNLIKLELGNREVFVKGRKKLSGDNRIVKIPSSVENLKNLRFLSLSKNNLASLPSEIGNLSNLIYLDISENRLISLPPELGLLENLTQVKIWGNPLSSFPPELAEQGARAILSYLRSQIPAKEEQWLSKLLVVGEGGVGKTSIIRSLFGRTTNNNQLSTHGIDIHNLQIQHPEQKHIFMTLKTWDFGGQEIYHATHQFFITNRSLFLLVWNARHGWEQGKLIHWLDVIHARAPESPIVIVATHIDERNATLPAQELQQAYPQIAAFCAVSNKIGTGISELRDKLSEIAAKLPLMGESWPKTWLETATKIREHCDKYITPQQLLDLMANHGVTGEDASILANWLHELGDILYYENDESLKNIVILKPQWVTKSISDVLESKDVIGRLGIFTRNHMHILWSELPPSLHDHFLRLMEQFDLSYRIPEHQDISLVVERLPLDPPEYQPAWNAIIDRQPCQEMTMRFRLNTIPPGVPTWFIARQHRFTTYTHWRSGVLFAQDNRDPYQAQHLALVTANAHDRTVTLAVRGPYPHNFFALLKDGLELTLARFPGLKIEREMPCPTPGCTHYFNYEDLQRRLQKKPEIECPKCWQDISVPQLLFGIDWRTQDAVIERLNTLVSGQQEILKETRQLKELTDREFLALFRRDQRLEESHCPNVFLLYPVQTEWYRKPFTKQKMGLHLCCQAPNEWHYTYHGYKRIGYYEFEVAADWLVRMAPYLKLLFRLVQLATPFFHASFGVSRADMEQEWGHHVDLMNSLLTHLPAMDGAEFDDMEGLDRLPDELRSLRFEATGAALRQIRALLDEQDPAREWGGLRKVLTPEGHYLWLCEYHAAQYRP